MGKLTTYLIVMSGLTLLFYFTGLLEATPNSTLLNLLLSPEKLESEPIALKAVTVVEAILASIIVVGFAVAGNVELGVMSAFAVYLFNLFWDYIAVFAVVASANPVIAVLLFSPMLIVYITTIIEWWRGITT